MRSIDLYGIIILKYIVNKYIDIVHIHGYDITSYCVIIDIETNDERMYIMIIDEGITLDQVYDMTSDLFISYVCIPIKWCTTSTIWRDAIDTILKCK